jgi:predicted esterase
MLRSAINKFHHATIAQALLCAALPGSLQAQDDVADVRAKRFTLQPRQLQYVLIAGEGQLTTPTNGYKLLVVLPGGDGGADFLPFVKRIYKHALSDEYLVVQLLAPKWNRSEQIVWPTEAVKAPAALRTERLVTAAVDDVAKRSRLDRRHIFTLSWSSGGPAAYAASLTEGTPVTGNFVAMSVFKPDQLPNLSRAQGKAYYILHSREDQVCPYWMAESARDELKRHGANVEFAEYDGGHGWRGNVYGNIRQGIAWLEEQTRDLPIETPAEDKD